MASKSAQSCSHLSLQSGEKRIFPSPREKIFFCGRKKAENHARPKLVKPSERFEEGEKLVTHKDASFNLSPFFCVRGEKMRKQKSLFKSSKVSDIDWREDFFCFFFL